GGCIDAGKVGRNQAEVLRHTDTGAARTAKVEGPIPLGVPFAGFDHFQKRGEHARIEQEFAALVEHVLVSRRRNFLDNPYLAGSKEDLPGAIIDEEEDPRSHEHLPADGVKLRDAFAPDLRLQDEDILEKDQVGAGSSSGGAE